VYSDVTKKYSVSEKIEIVGVEPTGFTVFHRTGASKTPTEIIEQINKIISQGFKPSKNTMYGIGMYSTLNLKSQLNNRMECSYGDGCIQYFVPKKGFIILDYTIARKVYPGDFSLAQQLLINGVYKKASDIPMALQALSKDLYASLKEPLVSADRALHIWYNCFDHNSSRDVANEIKQFEYPIKDEEIRELYAIADKAQGTSRRMSMIPQIQGIVYTGKNDGNVVLVYRPSPSIIHPRKWCVLAPGNRPSDIDNNTLNFAVEWQQVGGSQVSVTKTLIGDLIDRKVITPNKTFERIENNGSFKADELIKMEPWMRQGGSKFHKLYFIANKNKKNAIVAGVFRGGELTVHYFGTNSTDAREPVDILKCEFKKAVFLGGRFKGVEFEDALFAGGRFESGVFNGSWLGGTWVYDSKAVWGKNAKIVNNADAKSKFNSKFLKSDKWNSYILYKGETYPLDRPVPEWVVAFEKGTLNGDNISSSDETPETILSNLSKAVKINPPPTINIKSSLLTSTKNVIDIFKKHFSWMFQGMIKCQSSVTPVLTFDENKKTLAFEKGVIIAGKVQFNYYGKDAVIRSGVISGDNVFEGFLDGGNYTEGTFNGTWSRGALFIDKIKIGQNCNFLAPERDTKDGVSFLVKGTHWEAFKAPWLVAYNNDLAKFLTAFKSNADKTKKFVQDYFDKLRKTTNNINIDLDNALDYSDNDTD